MEGKGASKSQAVETSQDKIGSQQIPEASLLVSKTTSDDTKTEHRKSGCEPLKTNIVVEEDPVLIPIPSISSRSNSSATKTKAISQVGENSASLSKPEFIVNGEGIGGRFLEGK